MDERMVNTLGTTNDTGGVKQGEISIRLDQLEKVVSVALESANQVRTRVQEVLSNPTPEGDQHGTEGVGTPLADRIIDIIKRVERINDVHMDILERCEL